VTATCEAFLPVDWTKPCRVCDISEDALILVGSPYGGPVLVLATPAGPMRVYLEGEGKFELVTPDGAEALVGSAVEGVSLELGVRGVGEILNRAETLGAFIRQGPKLKFHARVDLGPMTRIERVVVREGLPATNDYDEIVFRDWRVIKEDGEKKIVLWEVQR
jgi:hypothetical protein